MFVRWADRQLTATSCFTVPRRTSVVCQLSDLVVDALWDAQPVKAGKSVGDVVRGSHVVDQP